MELRKLTVTRHMDLGHAPTAGDNRTIGIGRIEGVDEPPPPRAPAAAGCDIAAAPAGGGHAAGVGKRLGIDDVGSAIKQEIEWGAGTGPINARLYGRTRRHSYSRDPTAASPWWQSRHRAHQRLPDRDRIGAGK